MNKLVVVSFVTVASLAAFVSGAVAQSRTATSSGQAVKIEVALLATRVLARAPATSWKLSDGGSLSFGSDAWGTLGYAADFSQDLGLSEQVSLSNEMELGGSLSKNMSLRFDMSEDWGLSFSAHSQKTDATSEAEASQQGGAVPVVLSLSYEPKPGTQFTIFAGAELENAPKADHGVRSSSGARQITAVPLAGVGLSFSF
ncbi:hypothetical protein [Shimia sp. Alg240-R146]|uniref:hypothetical protein n=1 Tax=Shimia sp. Alg240-R146 TaxID=2993449 RepID=UPI0022E004E6|nr:hypothetical protein [Shimia sp. Alg240-R146]